MGRSAIVTASDSGIGKATAVALAESGFDLGITWHEDEAGAQDAAGEVRSKGVRAEVRRLDLTEPSEGVKVVEELIEALGGVYVFVNNAGKGVSSPYLDHGLDEWQDVLNVNLTGAFVCGQVAARHMVAAGEGGRIVNVTSVHEHVPKSESAAYCASKGGLGLLTKVMALELAEHGITVNSLAPGEISTPMTGQHDQDPRAEDRPGLPAGRPGSAHEMAAVVAFLASDGASYVTGHSLVADGGLMLMAAEANSRLRE